MIRSRALQRISQTSPATSAASATASASATRLLLLHSRTSSIVAPASSTARQYSTHIKEVTSSNPPAPTQPATNVSRTNEQPTSVAGAYDGYEVELAGDAAQQRAMQAPNRGDRGIWSRSQRPREQAMVGPRFEQMWMKDQPQPLSAMELIHKQPVRWRKEKIVSCDGGGGPLGHPRIFINLDKPQVNECTYCGLPFAKEQYRAQIEAIPNPPYPLEATGQSGEVGESQRITSEPLGQR